MSQVAAALDNSLRWDASFRTDIIGSVRFYRANHTYGNRPEMITVRTMLVTNHSQTITRQTIWILRSDNLVNDRVRLQLPL